MKSTDIDAAEQNFDLARPGMFGHNHNKVLFVLLYRSKRYVSQPVNACCNARKQQNARFFLQLNVDQAHVRVFACKYTVGLPLKEKVST